MMLTHVYYFPGWNQRRLPSMDAEDFETIPSSAEELSISSDGEDEGHNKNVCVWVYNVFICVLSTCFIHSLETFQICMEGEKAVK